ncbi:MAG: hypothetical protein NC824_03370 [Candidatus Omnitrophica bacterium]|nr:hypothetical protein [Candidatus Omnitrophota bacterium]
MSKSFLEIDFPVKNLHKEQYRRASVTDISQLSISGGQEDLLLLSDFYLYC